MPEFLPFRGVRYGDGVGDLSSLTAPPYDVIDEEQRGVLEARDPHNVVRLTLPGDRYDEAGALLEAWLAEGVLVEDGGPRFYVYRMGDTSGVIGALELRRPGEGGVLPHERTLPKAKSDRLDLLRATRANLEPIWGLSLTVGLSGLLEPAGDPLGRCTDEDGVEHTLWALAPGREAAVAGAVAASPVVIADGHHRYETSLDYRDDHPEAAHIMILVVELAEDQLDVRPIHRLVHGVPGHLDLDPWFEVTDAGPNEPETVEGLDGSLALVGPERCSVLTPREPGDDVDAARFEAVVAPLLGDARVTYRHDASAVADAVRKGDADLAFLLRPVPVPVIREVAERGERMPQKTTFFAPKPRTGMVLRRLN